jgi:hypothetical protein
LCKFLWAVLFSWSNFCEKSKLSLKRVCLLFTIDFFWRSAPQKTKMKLKMSSKSVVDWKSFLQEVCWEMLINNPVLIGGEGHVVQLTRLCFYGGSIMLFVWYENSGFLCNWLHFESLYFGLCSRSQSWNFACCSAKFVLPGSIVFSDCWAAYYRINHLGYEHSIVNHRLHFVDPVTCVNTNRVEKLVDACGRKK